MLITVTPVTVLQSVTPYKEATSLFKVGSKYYMLASETQGYQSSRTYYYTADSITGTWSSALWAGTTAWTGASYAGTSATMDISGASTEEGASSVINTSRCLASAAAPRRMAPLICSGQNQHPPIKT
ncbi:hypothetical protein M3194_17440 [Paenibacillus glycanilyticus]|uniref:hypothetical protein n=1 Tax=Paenibacillus glycanilyticus TaxID=126569 RepID=UPI0020425CAF|nr:hypothetical protein [Paenibacillus glycanilyticus]MCM3629130.1 hypothetical protein [Paenibacillus glycanilyticus]